MTMLLFILQGYFNGIRPELYDKNISVTTICPGPTFSNFLEAAFTGKPGEVSMVKATWLVF